MSNDRETVVVTNGGSGLGTILGVLLIIALLVAVWYFTLGPGATPATNDGGNTTPSLELPSVPAPSV